MPVYQFVLLVDISIDQRRVVTDEFLSIVRGHLNDLCHLLYSVVE